MIHRVILMGARARKHPEYCYRVPGPQMLTLTPDSDEASEITMRVDDVAQAEWKLGPSGADGLATAELRLLPTEATMALQPRVILVKRVAKGGLFWKQYMDEMIKEAFE